MKIHVVVQNKNDSGPFPPRGDCALAITTEGIVTRFSGGSIAGLRALVFAPEFKKPDPDLLIPSDAEVILWWHMGGKDSQTIRREDLEREWAEKKLEFPSDLKPLAYSRNANDPAYWDKALYAFLEELTNWDLKQPDFQVSTALLTDLDTAAELAKGHFRPDESTAQARQANQAFREYLGQWLPVFVGQDRNAPSPGPLPFQDLDALFDGPACAVRCAIERAGDPKLDDAQSALQKLAENPTAHLPTLFRLLARLDRLKPRGGASSGATLQLISCTSEQDQPAATLYFDAGRWLSLEDSWLAYAGTIPGEGLIPIPIFLTSNPDARLLDGLAIPPEFVLSTHALDQLPTRIGELRAFYPKGVPEPLLRAMGVGLFRRHLLMDDENHGLGEMDTTVLRYLPTLAEWRAGDGRPWLEVIEEKVEATLNGLDNGSRAFQTLFKANLEKISEVVNSLSEANESPPSPEDAADRIEDAYPKRRGRALLSRLPLLKHAVLVLDDEVDETTMALRETKVDGEFKLGDVYEFVGVRVHDHDVEVGQGNSLRPMADPLAAWCRVLKQKFDRLRDPDLRRFDLVLLDLSLGEGVNQEPVGYQILPALRKFFPDIPLIVYTRYRNMVRIERAFRRGASWYLPKSERHKLAAHHEAMLTNRLWRREWDLCKTRVPWDHECPQDLTDEARYLIWKSVEHLPGDWIRVRRLGGGIGGAQTVQVSRRINGRYDRATPVVVKIDRFSAMRLEQERFLRFVEPYTANQSGRITGPVHAAGEGHAAIAYSFTGASGGRHSAEHAPATLLDLMRQNLAGPPFSVLPADRYLPTLRTLIHGFLRQLHSVDSLQEDGDADFPNLALGEPLAVAAPSVVGRGFESYLWRLPAPYSLAWSENKAGKELQSPDALRCHVMEAKDGILQAIARIDPCGPMVRVDIAGPIGAFVARFRNLRAFQTTTAQGKLVHDPTAPWESLWSPGAPAEPGFLFAEHPSLPVDSSELAGKVAALIDWLTDPGEKPAQALDAARIGIIHGDCHLENVMVEHERGGPPLPTGNPWMIDFAKTRRDRVVIDFVQLEVSLSLALLKFKFFTPPAGTTQEAQVSDFIRHFLLHPTSPGLADFDNDAFRFVLAMMREVRCEAMNGGVTNETEYLAARTWECLVAHKLAARKWKKKPNDHQAREMARWSLDQAFACAEALGWRGG